MRPTYTFRGKNSWAVCKDSSNKKPRCATPTSSLYSRLRAIIISTIKLQLESLESQAHMKDSPTVDNSGFWCWQLIEASGISFCKVVRCIPFNVSALALMNLTQAVFVSVHGWVSSCKLGGWTEEAWEFLLALAGPELKADYGLLCPEQGAGHGCKKNVWWSHVTCRVWRVVFFRR